MKPPLLIPRDLLDDLETFVLDHSAQIQHERCRSPRPVWDIGGAAWQQRSR